MATAVLSLSQVIQEGCEGEETSSMRGLAKGLRRQLDGAVGQWNEARKDLKRRLVADAKVPSPSRKFPRSHKGHAPHLSQILGVKASLSDGVDPAPAQLDLSTVHNLQTDLLQFGERALDTLLQFNEIEKLTHLPAQLTQIQGEISQLATTVNRLLIHLSYITPVVTASPDSGYASALYALVDEVRNAPCRDTSFTVKLDF